MAWNRRGRWKGFPTRGAKYHKKGHLSEFSEQAPSTALSVKYIFVVSKIPWKQKWTEKIGMCFLWVQKKDYPLTLASCFFKKISTLQAFNCKKSSQNISKVRLLSSFASQNTLRHFFRFISSVFSLCIGSSIQLFNLSCDMYISTSF